MLGRAQSFIIVAVAALMLAATQRAFGAAGDFQYGTTVTPGLLTTSGSSVGQTGVGNFTTPAAPTFSAAVNPAGTDIVVGTISITDLGLTSAHTDTYGPSTIAVNLKVKDVASGSTGTFTFNGVLSGTVAGNGTTDGAVFNNPFVAASSTQTIGTESYTVSIIPSVAFAAPGAPPLGGTGLAGTYTFNVHATAVPEPAGIAVAGLAALGVLRRRRRDLAA